MHECLLSDEIQEFISHEDFNKLLSVPKITEDDIHFKKARTVKELISGFEL